MPKYKFQKGTKVRVTNIEDKTAEELFSYIGHEGTVVGYEVIPFPEDKPFILYYVEFIFQYENEPEVDVTAFMEEELELVKR